MNTIRVFILTVLACITSCLAIAQGSFLLSSSPSGRYVLIKKGNIPDILVYDLQLKDTISRITDTDKVFMGWQSDSTYFYVQKNKELTTLKMGNINNTSTRVIKKLDEELSNIIAHSNYTLPNHHLDTPFFIYIANDIIYKYNFISNKKEKILNLNNHFDGSQTIDYVAVSSLGSLLLNVQQGDKNGIYFLNTNGTDLLPIDTSKYITPESYCFFFKDNQRFIYYQYHKSEEETTQIDVVEKKLQDLKSVKYQTLPKGVVPSLAIDIPLNKLFFINSIVLDSSYSISMEESIFSGSVEAKKILFEIVGSYMSKLMSSFTAIPYNYHTYTLKLKFIPNTATLEKTKEAAKIISDFSAQIQSIGYRNIIVIPNADYSQATFDKNRNQAFNLMESRAEVIKNLLVNTGINKQMIEIQLGKAVEGTTNTTLQVW